MFCREVRLPTSLSFSRRIHGRLAGFYFFAWKATKDQRAAVPYEPYYTGTPRPDAHASLRGWIESYAERDMVWSRVVQGHETKRTGQLCECDYGSGPARQAEWASGLLSSIFRRLILILISYHKQFQHGWAPPCSGRPAGCGLAVLTNIKPLY